MNYESLKTRMEKNMNEQVPARYLKSIGNRVLAACCALIVFLSIVSSESVAGTALFNVHDYGASGNKADNCQTSIQKTVDACGDAGGGMVYFPPGDYIRGNNS